MKTMKRILVAHDGSKAACRALLKATELAGKFGGRLTVLTVLPCCCLEQGARQKTKRCGCKDVMRGVDEILHSAGVKGETVILPGEDPARVIIDHASSTGADLVVIGSRRRQAGRRGPWGSVSSKVAAQAPCTVFVV